MSEPLPMVHTYKVADESANRSRLPAWFDYIAGNHRTYCTTRSTSTRRRADGQSPGAPWAGVDGKDVAAVHGAD